MTDREFEQLITQIHEVLDQTADKVVWNEHIPDPDNPGQLRQIDVTVTRKGRVTHIECRHRSAKQNATWVEELCGRRRSLKAHKIIGVSSSGFTKGAIAKAKRLGVILREFDELSYNEVSKWAEFPQVFVDFIQFNKALLTIVSSATETRRLSHSPSFEDGNGRPWPVDEVFKQAADQIERAGIPPEITMEMFPKDLAVDGIRAKEIFLSAKCVREKVPIDLPMVAQYSQRSPARDHTEATYHASRSSRFRLITYDESKFAPIVDLSEVLIPDGCVFRGIVFGFAHPVSPTQIQTLGLDRTVPFKMPFSTSLTHEGSQAHVGVKMALARAEL